jgi:hypothetical protein
MIGYARMQVDNKRGTEKSVPGGAKTIENVAFLHGAEN